MTWDGKMRDPMGLNKIVKNTILPDIVEVKSDNFVMKEVFNRWSKT